MSSKLAITKSKYPKVPTKVSRSTAIKCNFCSGPHVVKACPLEKSMKTVLKRKMGVMAEQYVANNVNCPVCNYHSLQVMGNDLPSLDIVCKNCLNIFEVKSKCLSVDGLPLDLHLEHGTFRTYEYRKYQGLNLFIVIYGIDRINKLITIREVLYAPNEILWIPTIIEVQPKPYTYDSTIFIKDRLSLIKINLQTAITKISFKKEVEMFIRESSIVLL